jgi:hypothetical protein
MMRESYWIPSVGLYGLDESSLFMSPPQERSPSGMIVLDDSAEYVEICKEYYICSCQNLFFTPQPI